MHGAKSFVRHQILSGRGLGGAVELSDEISGPPEKEHSEGITDLRRAWIHLYRNARPEKRVPSALRCFFYLNGSYGPISPSPTVAPPMQPSAKLFEGKYAVFRDNVPDFYLEQYVKLGGIIVRKREELADAIFLFCDSKYNSDFITACSEQALYLRWGRDAVGADRKAATVAAAVI
ncbi:hypothetical protein DFH09DRAFT_1069453 [Mycena vulgaris]|nr:hypothetical protein DFH09DRAFT_1069453 [Mycena vulgaris]